MNRRTVESSSVKSVGHEGETLEVEFASGEIYRYEPVTAQTYNDLMGAPSIGKFINAMKSFYDCWKLVQKKAA